MAIVKTQKSTTEWHRRVEYLETQILEKMGIWEEAGDEKHLAHIVFSTRLLYKIREIIEPFGLDISWGQLYDREKKEFGPECDLIIFKGEPVEEWNKNKNRKKRSIIRVVLVNKDDVFAVIECKCTLKTKHNNPNNIGNQKKLKNKITRFKEFGLNKEKIWLVAENIVYKDKSEKAKIREIVLAHLEYGKLFYLNDVKKDEPNEKDWNLFLDEIAHLR